MFRILVRLVLGTATIAALALGVLAPAQAGLPSSTCGPRDLSQAFLPWLDPAQYFLMAGGDVESSAGWTLAGGARVVRGNEPFYVHKSTDARSLLVPSGAWARTSSTCVDSDEPTLRFFVRNTGSILSTLVVDVRIRTTVFGVMTETTLPLGVVPGTTSTWQPALPIVFELSANQLLGSTSTVDFRFSAVGGGGNWQVDDVYVDPFKDW